MKKINKLRIAVVLLVSMLASSFVVASVSACETRTPGYWKNHYPNAWPTSPTILYTDVSVPPNTHYSWTLPGGSLVDAENILMTPVKGDARINLEQKVIAAVLSIAADNREGWAWPGNYLNGPMNGETLPELITNSVNLLNENPGAWTPGSAAAASGVRAQGLALASAIDYWLNFYDIG